MWRKCKELQDHIVEMRRALHRIPELGSNLPKTQAYVCAELDKLGVKYTKNKADSGIVALIEGGKPGKAVALRADMDALPVTEATGVDYASQHEGRMHACGHDSHAAMLLAAAKVLNENRAELNGSVKLLFQTAEETAKGAQAMIDENALENPHVDAIFGLHIGNIIPGGAKPGTFCVTPGRSMASYDRFVLKVTGKGCHGSAPEQGHDPIVTAANIIIALEEIIAREIRATCPAVLTVGSIHGGFAFNVIPGEVVIEGTTRALDEDTRQYLAKRIGEVASGIAKTYRAECELEMDWGAPPLVNDPEMAAFAAKSLGNIAGSENVITSIDAPNMGSEDFACYLTQRPGAFILLSSENPDKGTNVAHHNAKFNIDEDVMWMGAAAYVAVACDYLKK